MIDAKLSLASERELRNTSAVQSWIHVLEWRSTSRADVPALVDDRGVRLTYAELLDVVERRAGGWAGQGVRPGDTVAVLARNSADFLVHMLAVERAGAIPALLNWRLSVRELADLVALVQPVAVVADAEFVPLAEAAAPRLAVRVVIGEAEGWVPDTGLDAPAPPRPSAALGSDAVMALVHTSGTTGRPKAIPLVHGSLIRAVSASALEIGDQVAGSAHLQVMPLFHLGGLGQAMQCLLTAGTLHLMAAFEPAAAVDAIERERIQFSTLAPSIVDALVAEIRRRPAPPDLSSLRELQYGSAPITPTSLAAALPVLGCRFRQIYGCTESQSMIALLAPEDHEPGSPKLATAGQVAFGWEVRVVDAAGVDLPPGRPGELLIKGDSLFPGYWRDPASTAAAFTGDGWYRTGDVASVSADRYLTVHERVTDMVISGGENVYPAEVEAVLAGHPAVSQVAVIGVPDPRWGEAVHAVVVPADGVVADPDLAADLRTWARERLAHFKCPQDVEFVDALPRTATGKVLRRELRTARADRGQVPA
jgi:acyl-CoA synthetase (AMP-forming)/AMP-acid ligase II